MSMGGGLNMSSGDKCRWECTDYLEPNFKFCPYCGREIEVVKDEQVNSTSS